MILREPGATEYVDYPRSLNLLSHTTHTVAVVAIIVIGRIDVRRVEVEVVGVVRIRVRPTRPNVPV